MNEEEIIKEFRKQFPEFYRFINVNLPDGRKQEFSYRDFLEESKIEQFLLSALQQTEQRVREEMGEKIKNRDAYKMPFSDNEIEMELNPTNRALKNEANYWYKKGRNDENKDLITLLTKKD